MRFRGLQMLIDGSAEIHIDKLNSSAHSQHRYFFFAGDIQYVSLSFVQLVINFHGAADFFPPDSRVDIVIAARHDNTVRIFCLFGIQRKAYIPCTQIL